MNCKNQDFIILYWMMVILTETSIQWHSLCWLKLTTNLFEHKVWKARIYEHTQRINTPGLHSTFCLGFHPGRHRLYYPYNLVQNHKWNIKISSERFQREGRIFSAYRTSVFQIASWISFYYITSLYRHFNNCSQVFSDKNWYNVVWNMLLWVAPQLLNDFKLKKRK